MMRTLTHNHLCVGVTVSYCSWSNLQISSRNWWS
jgi:hypothetical protein